MEEDYNPCDAYGHEDYITYEDDDIIQFECRRCGAELDPVYKSS